MKNKILMTLFCLAVVMLISGIFIIESNIALGLTLSLVSYLFIALFGYANDFFGGDR